MDRSEAECERGQALSFYRAATYAQQNISIVTFWVFQWLKDSQIV